MEREEGSEGKFTPEVGSLFSFSKDWKPTKHATKITVSNGLAWSEDQKLIYYIDSTIRKVDAFDFDAENAKICKYSCTGVWNLRFLEQQLYRQHVQECDAL